MSYCNGLHIMPCIGLRIRMYRQLCNTPPPDGATGYRAHRAGRVARPYRLLPWRGNPCNTPVPSVGADDERSGAKRNKYPWGIRPPCHSEERSDVGIRNPYAQIAAPVCGLARNDRLPAGAAPQCAMTGPPAQKKAPPQGSLLSRRVSSRKSRTAASAGKRSQSCRTFL